MIQVCQIQACKSITKIMIKCFNRDPEYSALYIKSKNLVSRLFHIEKTLHFIIFNICNYTILNYKKSNYILNVLLFDTKLKY